MRAKKLKPVIDYSQSQENDAAKKLSTSQDSLGAAEKRLDELIQYRNEYATMFGRLCGVGANATRMQDFRSFLDKLDVAIAQQRYKVEMAKFEHDIHKSEWLGKHRRRRALDKVAQRYDNEDRRQQQQREQKESDEAVSRAYAQRIRGKES